MLFKAAIGFVAAQCDAFELFELAEEILDEVAPVVDFGVDVEWFSRCGRWEMKMPAPRSFNSAIGIECLVGDQGTKLHASN